ncbi:type II toxin-antitoxin system prevent-host-death family antitoxin [Streptomyces albus]|uniref:type II toxin-antitoxin system prevent-host-death family antitoxin n=1 Tax=Streptomyces sp. NRRL F-5639 TaxID=1463867 RepID=UPI0004CA515B|nr:type II toxin-antitoxin system prevent-host-death family antitoxin [Streptomyces sp. NRRL F-5639]
MANVELNACTEDFEELIRHIEDTGERLTVTDDGEPAGVLLPAAELAELEHFAQRAAQRGPRPWTPTTRESPLGPVQQGPYTRYAHPDGVRMTFTRDRAVVAELRSVEEFDWLQEKASSVRQGYMDPKQAAAFEVFLAWQRPIGDGIAWIADDWKEQHPFRILEFLKGPSPEEAALAYGADPQDITDGLQLHEIWERDEEEHTDDFFDVIAFGEADGWTWLGYHEHNSASLRAPLDPPPSERITLTATMAKGIYDFSYEKDGVYQNPFPAEYGEQPRRDMYEIPWYTPGEPPFHPEAPLSFLNPHLRRAEEQTDWTGSVPLFLAALERAFALDLPREALTTGNVRCARLRNG